MTAAMRDLVRETVLCPADLVAPLFVAAGLREQQEIDCLPGQYQWPVEQVAREAAEIAALGIRAVILFGVPARKDPVGSENYSPEGVIPRAIRAIKAAVPDLVVISDMCFCEYTDHGHCGIVNLPGTDFHRAHLPHGCLLDEPTLELLARASVVHAQAGADVIAPSGMIDGMVRKIRQALDVAGFEYTAILSYAVKYASAFYGPFREAASCRPLFGDRAGYQMDPANFREAQREVLLDLGEGADMVMVKPAMPCLDVIRSVRLSCDVPVAAYQVSGEYAMIWAAAERGWLNLKQVALEALIAIKRAGADFIITYFAKQAAGWLRSEG